jgi:hypothetical protein
MAIAKLFSFHFEFDNLDISNKYVIRVFPDLPNQFSVKIETIVQGTVE